MCKNLFGGKMEMLKCNNATYFYKGTRNGVENISFEAFEGDRIAIVGKNGAGKTTFLNMLSGITTPVSGSISCREDMNYHDLGFSSQKQSIDWYLNVYDNVLLGMLLTGANRRTANMATQRIIQLMDLAEYAKCAPDGLSGGQQQRVQVARALVHEPQIMVLDEPTSGLDFHYSKALFDYLYEKCTKEKKLLLVSSHDLTLLEDYCNKILFFESGKQIFFGDMKEFLAQNIVSKKITIHFSGTLGEEIKKQIISKQITLSDDSVSFFEEQNIDLNAVIDILLQEVKVQEINSEHSTLKDVLSQRGGE